jgi:hypothetical protein
MVDARRPWNRLLLGGSVVCGTAAFVVAVVLSQIVALPAEDATPSDTPIVVCLVLFIAFVIGCMVMGYAAARQRTPARPRDSRQL